MASEGLYVIDIVEQEIQQRKVTECRRRDGVMMIPTSWILHYSNTHQFCKSAGFTSRMSVVFHGGMCDALITVDIPYLTETASGISASSRTRRKGQKTQQCRLQKGLIQTKVMQRASRLDRRRHHVEPCLMIGRMTALSVQYEGACQYSITRLLTCQVTCDLLYQVLIPRNA